MKETELLLRAEIAEQSDNHEDVIKCMKKVIKIVGTDDKMTQKMRNLFAIGYKNYISEKRSALKVLKRILESPKHIEKKDATTILIKKVEEEIIAICKEVQDLLAPLIETAQNIETKAFYYKMKGDYQRYLAELSCDTYKDAKDTSLKFYDEALVLGLPASHPLSLAITLNRAILFYIIMNEKETAINMLREAMAIGTNAFPDRQTQPLIIKLLQDNLHLWT